MRFFSDIKKMLLFSTIVESLFISILVILGPGFLSGWLVVVNILFVWVVIFLSVFYFLKKRK